MPRGRVLPVPSPSLVVMIGAAASGKTTFCRRHFLPTQIVSSDDCRAAVADDPSDQEATPAAFDLAHRIADERLRRARLTVFDATSVEAAARRPLLDLAARHHLPAVACVLDLPVETCLAFDRRRDGRRVGRSVIARHARLLAASLPRLRDEGFAAVHRLDDPGAAARAKVRLEPLPCDRTSETGPFDIIGDVHGCAGELLGLLARLGYERCSQRAPFRHPEGRRAVFLGDLVDRGPRVVEVTAIAMAMVAAGTAMMTPGNRDVELVDSLGSRRKERSSGRLVSIRQIEALRPAARRRFLREFPAFVRGLPPHLVLDGGRLAVAHAGLRTEHVGRHSEEVRRFALDGDTTGDLDRYGLPVRVQWAAAYRGRPFVAYGHTPVPDPERIGNTLNLDTGCVYGGRLTALCYPEMRIVSVPAGRPYYRSPRAIPERVGLRAETRIPPAT